MFTEVVRSVVSIIILVILAIGVASIPTLTQTLQCTGADCPVTGLPLESTPQPETIEKLAEPVTEEAPTSTPPVITSLPKITEPKVPVIETPPIEPILTGDPTTTTATPTPFSEINTYARNSLVNILCVAQSAGAVGSITGSGIMIDAQGIILTNAHIAQYLLVKDWPTKDSLDCTIRMGSPAKPLYRAEILYLNPHWIAENSDVIASEDPKGTGEFDYALLRIHEATDKNRSVPKNFAYATMRTNEYGDELEGTTVLLAGYPAGFLGGISIVKDLYAASSITSVGKLYTFGTTTVDVFSLGGTIIAQQGSSGGGVFDRNKELIGLIVTSTTGATTDERDLRAITLPYINRDFLHFTGVSLENLLQRNLYVEAEAFNTLVAPALREALIQSLE